MYLRIKDKEWKKDQPDRYLLQIFTHILESRLKSGKKLNLCWFLAFIDKSDLKDITEKSQLSICRKSSFLSKIQATAHLW